MKVHKVEDGPYESPYGDDQYFLVCICEENDKVFTEDVYFQNLDKAYKFKNLFRYSIEPVDLRTGVQHE